MSRLIPAFEQFFDDAGDPLISGLIDFFEAGSSTIRKDTFADSAETKLNPNPVELTGAGRVPNVFGTGSYRAISRTSAGVQILQRDPVGGDALLPFGGDWSPSQIYSVTDVVRDGGDYWESLVNNNLNNKPSTDDGTNWQEAIVSINDVVDTSGRIFSTVAAMKANKAVTAGQIVSTTEHTTGFGARGGNSFLVRAVTGATDDNGSVIKSTGNTALEFFGLFPDGVNVLQFGADPTKATDSTTAFTNAVPFFTLNVTEGDYAITSVPITMEGAEFILEDNAYLHVTGNGLNRNIQQDTRAVYIAANGGLPAALVDGFNLYRTFSVTGGHIIVESGGTGISDRIPFLQFIGVAPTPAKTGLQPFPTPLAVDKVSVVLNDSTAAGVRIHGGWGSYVINSSFTGFDSGTGIQIGGDGTFETSSHPQGITIENNDFSSCGPIFTLKGTCTNSTEGLNIIGNVFQFVSDITLTSINAMVWEENYYVTNDGSIIITDSGRAQFNGGYYQAAQNGVDATHDWLIRVTNCADFQMMNPEVVKNSTATTRNTLGFFTNASNDFVGISVHDMVVNGGVLGGDAITFTSTDPQKFVDIDIDTIYSKDHTNIVNFFPLGTVKSTNITLRDLTNQDGDGTVKFIEGFSKIDRPSLDAPQYHILMDTRIKTVANSSGIAEKVHAYTISNPFKSKTLAAGGIGSFVNISNAATMGTVARDRSSVEVSISQAAGLTAGDTVEATGTVDLTAVSV